MKEEHAMFKRTQRARTFPGLSRREFLRLSAAATAAIALRSQTALAGAPPQVRYNAKSLSIAQRALLIDAIKGTKTLPSLYDPSTNAYDYWVQLHYRAYYDPNMPAHMAAAFGPWHRWFMLLFEQELQQIHPEVTMPYWDWTVDQGADAYLWSDDFMGGEGDPDDRWILKSGPFRQGAWQLGFIDPKSLDQDGTIYDLQRHFGVYISGGQQTTRLPYAQEIADALSLPTYDVDPWDDHSDPAVSFRNNLEGFRYADDGSRLPSENHNRVHNWIGGAMSEGASPNDPVFWLHHSMVDLIYTAWQARWRSPYLPVSGARPHQNLTDSLWQLGDVTVDMTLDHRALGYVYDRELSAPDGYPWWASLAGSTSRSPRPSVTSASAATNSATASTRAAGLFHCILGSGQY